MNQSLQKTLQFLARTNNEAAVEVLIAALDSPFRPAVHGAVAALLQRRSPSGHKEIFRRLPTLDPQCRQIVVQNADRLTPVINEVLENSSPSELAAACEAAMTYRLYAVIPALAQAIVRAASAHTEIIAQTILQLTDQFYSDLAGGHSAAAQSELTDLREKLTAALEDAVRKFHRHRQPAVAEAFLMLAKKSNITLWHVLTHPDEAAYNTLLELLERSQRGGVIRLLLCFLDDPQTPRAVLQVLARRNDPKYLELAMRTIGPRPLKAVAENLARIEKLAWAPCHSQVWRELPEEAQEAAIRSVMASGMSPEAKLACLGEVLSGGKPACRRAAAQSLAEFAGPEATELVLRHLNDPDAEVRAHLLLQLRPRQVPGALAKLIAMADSSEPVVREALRRALPEFTVGNFLANFDEMDEAARSTAGLLVRKIDCHIADRLRAEMQVLSPVRRRRAVLAAQAMGAVADVEDAIAQLLNDEDHMVRIAAASALGAGKSVVTWEALRDALLDRSYLVKEAAEKSLEVISEALRHAASSGAQLQEASP